MHRAGQLLPGGIEQIDHAGRRLVADGIGGWRWFRAMGGHHGDAGADAGRSDVLRRLGLGFGVVRKTGLKGSGGMYGRGCGRMCRRICGRARRGKDTKHVGAVVGWRRPTTDGHVGWSFRTAKRTHRTATTLFK
ncbi:hypothetical protein GCM10009078_36180 [Cupriavidus gilardii]